MNKLALIFLALAPFISNGQNCDNFINKSTDKFTDKTYWEMKNKVVINNDYENSSIRIEVDALGDKTLTFSATIKSPEIGCIDEGIDAYFLFADGTKFQCVTHNSYNCKGRVTIFLSSMIGNKKLRKLLSEKLLSSFRISGKGVFFQTDISAADAENLKGSLNCLKEI